MILTKYMLHSGLSLTLRSPSDSGAFPLIILCHGFCGIQEILLPRFAEAFTAAGFATITFDYRGFGESYGERGRLSPSMQIEDIVSVVDWAETVPACVDGQRIALWGTSLGGCHVFGAAVMRSQIKCLISQMGFADGEAIVTGKMDANEKSAFISTMNKIQDKKERLGKEMFVSITKVLGDEESKLFFESNKEKYPEMDVKIPFLTVNEMFHYKPFKFAQSVTCPTLVVVAGEDTVNDPQQGVALFNATGAKQKELYIEHGAKHYDIYQEQHFENVVQKQINWAIKYLSDAT